VQLEFRGKKQHGDIIQIKEAVPFVDTRPPERDCESETQYGLCERRLSNRTNDVIHLFDKPAYLPPLAATGDLPSRARRHSTLLMKRGKDACREHSGDVSREIECRAVCKSGGRGRAERFAFDKAR
jgi:hypothetical protein